MTWKTKARLAVGAYYVAPYLFRFALTRIYQPPSLAELDVLLPERAPSSPPWMTPSSSASTSGASTA